MRTKNMSRFVFLSADEGMIELHIEKTLIGRVSTAKNLRNLLKINEVNFTDDIACSSSIDFCDEYGFEEGGAMRIIRKAFELL